MIENLNAQQLTAMLDAMPFELIFVDGNDRVQYRNKAGARKVAVGEDALGKDVRACHAKASLPKVEKILSDLKSGAADEAWFWMPGPDSRCLNRFIALRDGSGKYLGILQYVLDVEAIEAIATDRAGASPA